MRIITTHLSADFDAFASAVVAVRLFPGARVLLPGSQEATVRRFLEETQLPFPELRLREARRVRFDHVVIVDTRSARRLGEVWDLLQREPCPITLIDHHVSELDTVRPSEDFSRPVGATCTVVAQMMQERDLAPTSEEASLLLLGIYEDTGGLSFEETTSDDLRVAAWLLEHGGSLDWVRRWVLKGMKPEQLELLNQVVDGTEELRIHGYPVSISMVEVDRYHEEAAVVVHRWVETFDIRVGAVMLVQPPHVNLILRSRLEGFHAGRVAQRFGGGGHATAASARVSDRMPVELREELLSCLHEEMPPGARAIDIAIRKIFTVDVDTEVWAAKERLNHLRVNALPVRDPERGELVGQVTRQILDRALIHEMDRRPVNVVMQPGVPTVAAETALEDLMALFLERSYRFVIVAENDRPAGLITRMDLFRTLHGQQSSAGAGIDRRMAGARPMSQSISRLLREVAPAWVHDLLETVRRVADAQRVPVYLVGGVVRDLLLGRANEDLDLVVEGSGITFAEALAAETGGRCHPHTPFLTAVVTLPDHHKVDIASARTEFYRTPAALPVVATSLIRQDLYRRDFTVNALAISVSGERYGELIDFFGGRRDLQRGEIRVLHSLSFIDDPTRAIRAVRHARRLGFAIAQDTRNLIATAIQEGVFTRLSGQRLRRELEILLSEPHPPHSLALLQDLGVLAAVLKDLVWRRELYPFLLEVEGQVAWYQVEQLGAPPEGWILYLGAMVLHADSGSGEAVADRLQLTGTQRERLVVLPDLARAVAEAGDPHLSRSARLRRVEAVPAEALLLGMARLPLDQRRLVADAAAAAVRVESPVKGRDLIGAGIPPGPWVGRALARARDALVDGKISPAEAFDFAVACAAEAAEAVEDRS